MVTKKLQILGSFGGSSVEVDATLSQEGKAADAKAVGDAIAAANIDEVYVQADEPVDAPNGSIWVDLDEDADDFFVGIETDSTLSIEGAAADAKVTGEKISDLQNLVGETSVADQISEAITEVYVQADEPTEASVGTIWVDTDEEGLSNTEKNPTARVYVVDAATTDVSTVDFSMYTIGDVIIVTSS